MGHGGVDDSTAQPLPSGVIQTVIVDCHTHIWENRAPAGLDRREDWTPGDAGFFDREASARAHRASTDEHLEASKPCDKSFVLGFKSRFLGVEIPNELISKYVRSQPERLIGFMGVDPTDIQEAMDDLAQAKEDPSIKGITVSPAAQDFHPADSRAMQVFAEAARLNMPVLLHMGIHFTSGSKMEFAKPVLLDEVARELPNLKLVIAHLGYPWIDECVVLLGRHRNVYADVSALIARPWKAYNALLSAYQYGVIDKLLFGSDFPYSSAATAIESLFRLNQLVTGTNLPTIPRQYLAAIVERDALSLLGIAHATPSLPKSDKGLLDAVEH